MEPPTSIKIDTESINDTKFKRIHYINIQKGQKLMNFAVNNNVC